MKRWSKAIASALRAMAMSFGVAKANTFDVSTYSGTLFGTLNIDVTTGTVIAADITKKAWRPGPL
jgi:hypothetical protein